MTSKLESELYGGQGIHKGIREIMREKALIARCQWHKRENVVEYLAKERRDGFSSKLQGAYEGPNYEIAIPGDDTPGSASNNKYKQLSRLNL